MGKEPIRAPNRSNISPDGKKCLRDLAKDSSIVIKQADKGGCIVVWDRDDYIKEGERQLSDSLFYQRVDSDPTMTHWEYIERFLLDLRDSG